MTSDKSLPTKQTVVFLNFNCDFNATVSVLIKIFKEPKNITNDSYIHTMKTISFSLKLPVQSSPGNRHAFERTTTAHFACSSKMRK